MAYIYKITNDINEKIYIGKTEFDIQKRFKEHCKDAYRDRNKKRPLYAAMKKYGIEHFYIELIEETETPEEREKYWIEYYNSYHNGYNATLGGDGKKYIDYEKVIELYKYFQNQKKVSEEMSIDVHTIHNILVNNDIKIVVPKQKGKKISAYDLDGTFIKTFTSQHEAAKWIIENNKTTSSDIKRIASNIGRAVDQKKRKTAFELIWKSIE